MDSNEILYIPNNSSDHSTKSQKSQKFYIKKIYFMCIYQNEFELKELEKNKERDKRIIGIKIVYNDYIFINKEKNVVDVVFVELKSNLEEKIINLEF